MIYYLQFVHIFVAFLLVFTKYFRCDIISLAIYTAIFIYGKNPVSENHLVFPLTYHKIDCKLVTE